MAVANDWLRVNSQWVREFFHVNPRASVDDCARASNNARKGVPRGLIADIRRQVKREIETNGKFSLDALPPEPPPLSVVASESDETDESEAKTEMNEISEPSQQNQPKTAIATASRYDPEGIEARKKYLNDLVEANPNIEPLEADKLIREKFGLSTNRYYIYETIRAARELHGLPNVERRRRRSDPKGLEAAAPAASPPVVPPAPTVSAQRFEAELATQSIEELVMLVGRWMRGQRMAKVVVSLDKDGNLDFETERMSAEKGRLKL